jgi:hypothetical protein
MRIFLLIFLVLMVAGFWTVPYSVANHHDEGKSFVYDDHGKRDPFLPLVSPSGVLIRYETDLLISDLALEGIMSGVNGKNLAIINGSIVDINDTVGQFTVYYINTESVVLKKGKQKFKLLLKKEE